MSVDTTRYDGVRATPRGYALVCAIRSTRFTKAIITYFSDSLLGLPAGEMLQPLVALADHEGEQRSLRVRGEVLSTRRVRGGGVSHLPREEHRFHGAFELALLVSFTDQRPLKPGLLHRDIAGQLQVQKEVDCRFIDTEAYGHDIGSKQVRLIEMDLIDNGWLARQSTTEMFCDNDPSTKAGGSNP